MYHCKLRKFVNIFTHFATQPIASVARLHQNMFDDWLRRTQWGSQLTALPQIS